MLGTIRVCECRWILTLLWFNTLSETHKHSTTAHAHKIYYIIIQYNHIRLLQLSIQILTTIMHTTVSTCIYITSCLRDNTASTSYHALQTIQQVYHIMHYRKYTISCTTGSTPYHVLQQVHRIMHTSHMVGEYVSTQTLVMM